MTRIPRAVQTRRLGACLVHLPAESFLQSLGTHPAGLQISQVQPARTQIHPRRRDLRPLIRHHPDSRGIPLLHTIKLITKGTSLARHFRRALCLSRRPRIQRFALPITGLFPSL